METKKSEKKKSSDLALPLNVLTFVAIFYSFIYLKPIDGYEMFWSWISVGPKYVWMGIFLSFILGMYFARKFDPTETKTPKVEFDAENDYEAESTFNYLGSFFKQLWIPDIKSSALAIIIVLCTSFFENSICFSEGTSLIGTIFLLLIVNSLTFRLTYKAYFYLFTPDEGVVSMTAYLFMNPIKRRDRYRESRNKEYGYGLFPNDNEPRVGSGR